MSFTLRLAVITMMLITAAALAMVAFQVVRPVPAYFPAQVASPAPLQTSYLVAAHALPPGTLAREEDFTTKMATVASLPPGAIADVPDARASMRGALVRNYVDAGSPITAADVLRPRDRGFIASVLEPGTRAVSIGVDPISGVSGLIWPGDHVDVILTQELDKAPVSKRVLSETILDNARVIGIDQEIVQGAPADNTVAGKLARTVTLQVKPDQAEKLAVAQHLGKLVLAICAADLAAPEVLGKPTTFGSDVSPALARTDEPVGVTVQLVEGESRKEVTFR